MQIATGPLTATFHWTTDMDTSRSCKSMRALCTHTSIEGAGAGAAGADDAAAAAAAAVAE